MVRKNLGSTGPAGQAQILLWKERRTEGEAELRSYEDYTRKFGNYDKTRERRGSGAPGRGWAAPISAGIWASCVTAEVRAPRSASTG